MTGGDCDIAFSIDVPLLVCRSALSGAVFCGWCSSASAGVPPEVRVPCDKCNRSP